jgi:hypothetical protein
MPTASSGSGRPTVNISVAMTWNEALQEALGVDQCSQCGKTLEEGAKVLLWPQGGPTPYGLLACSPLCWKKVREKVGGKPQIRTYKLEEVQPDA